MKKEINERKKQYKKKVEAMSCEELLSHIEEEKKEFKKDLKSLKSYQLGKYELSGLMTHNFQKHVNWLEKVARQKNCEMKKL